MSLISVCAVAIFVLIRWLLFIRKTAGLMHLPPTPIIREAGTNRLYLVLFKVPALQNTGNKG